MFKHVYVTELVQVVTRTLRFREPVGEGYLRPRDQIEQQCATSARDVRDQLTDELLVG